MCLACGGLGFPLAKSFGFFFGAGVRIGIGPFVIGLIWFVKWTVNFYLFMGPGKLWALQHNTCILCF